jgi:membrane-bound serine protease (ClpP class)
MEVPMWAEVLTAASNPILAYVLLMIGIYGLFFEVFTPGLVFPSILGVVCLGLSISGLYHLPVNWYGLALLIMGLVFIALEMFVRIRYLLGVLGVVAFAVGSALLIHRIGGETAIPGPVIAVVTVVTAGFFFWVLRFAKQARQRRVVSGVRGMVGEIAVVEADGEWVFVMGERWRFRAAEPLRPRQRVRIVRVEGIVLHVEPLTEGE